MFNEESDDDFNFDISPLIDVVFILLIFFMVTANFTKDQGIEIERPVADSSEQINDKVTKVMINESLEVTFNDQTVQPWMLQTLLKDHLINQKSKEVLVVADKKVSVDDLIVVVDQCKLSGAKNIIVASENGGGISL